MNQQDLITRYKNGDRDFTGVDLKLSVLNGANLHESDLRWAIFRESDLSWSDLSGANLHGADLSGSDLSGSNLFGYDLRVVDLRGCKLTGAKMDIPDHPALTEHLREAAERDKFDADCYDMEIMLLKETIGDVCERLDLLTHDQARGALREFVNAISCVAATLVAHEKPEPYTEEPK